MANLPAAQENPNTSSRFENRLGNLETSHKLFLGVTIGVIVVLFVAYIGLIIGYFTYMVGNNKDYTSNFETLNSKVDSLNAEIDDTNAKVENATNSLDKLQQSKFYYQPQ